MSDQPQTAEELIAHIQAQNQIAHEQLTRTINVVVEQGREDFRDFDQNMDGLRDTVGADKLPAITQLALNFENPARLLNYLAENPTDAKRVAAMSAGRKAAELARLEARLMPDAASADSSEPPYLKRAKGGEKRGLGDDVDDATWERNFRRKYPNGFNPYDRSNR